jgi:tetratricopeptide (TPR) repeat protein
MGRHDEAISQQQETLELDPDFASAHCTLGYVYEAQGRFVEAIEEFQKARVPSGSGPYGLADLGYAYARSGDEDRATEVLRELLGLLKQGYSVSSGIALVYHGLGDRDKALEWLEKALADRAIIPDLKVSPVWRGLRSDPRFIAILKKMGLED